MSIKVGDLVVRFERDDISLLGKIVSIFDQGVVVSKVIVDSSNPYGVRLGCCEQRYAAHLLTVVERCTEEQFQHYQTTLLAKEIARRTRMMIKMTGGDDAVKVAAITAALNAEFMTIH